jgi:hypothetical protein
MMIGIVGIMISCMKFQETYIVSKVKYSEKEMLRSTTLLGEETSILTVDSEEEDEEEEWVEAEDISYVITAHNLNTFQGIVRTLLLLASTATRLTML